MKGSFEYDMLVKHCKKVAEKWPNEINFSHIAYKGSENTKINTKQAPKERKIWKAAGLYYAILSDKSGEFYNSFSNVCSVDEFTTLSKNIKDISKVDAISKLRTFIQTLNKRKKRLTKSEVLEAPPLLNSSLQSHL
jgi:hypothetical protein